MKNKFLYLQGIFIISFIGRSFSNKQISQNINEKILNNIILLKNFYSSNIFYESLRNFLDFPNNQTKQEINTQYISKIQNYSESNETDICAQKTDEFLQLILDPINSNKTADDYMGFFLYSAIGLNDYGDYSSCTNNENYNYILVNLNLIPGLNTIMGLCYLKECQADYFNKSKDKIIHLINQRFSLNVTSNQIAFTNPKNIYDNYKSSITTGLLISLVIISIIASFSIIQLVIYYLESINKSNFQKHKFQNENYINFIENQKEGEYKTSEDLSYENLIHTAKGNKIENESLFIKFFKNFDLIRNARSIFKISNQNKSLEYMRIFDGVRFLSTCWVLWGHTFLIAVISGPKNFYDLPNQVEKLFYPLLGSAFLSVDVFFYLSGFLLYFSLIKYSKNVRSYKDKVIFFLFSFFQRYVRLLPLYAISIFIIPNVLPYLIDGPKTSSLPGFFDACSKYYWANLLYIQNFITYEPGENRCAPHTWYLGDDMVYFIVTTIIILMIRKNKIFQNVVIGILFIYSVVWQILKCIDNNYTISFKDLQKMKGDYFNDFYIQPVARITPYLMGILYCELFFHTDIYSLSKTDSKDDEYKREHTKKESLLKRVNNKIKNSDLLTGIIFIVSLIEINYGVFIYLWPQNEDLGPGYQAFFITCNKLFFINGLGNIIHLIFLERLDFIRKFLSLNIFTRLSKITYGIYLLHYFFIMGLILNSDTSFRFDFIEISFLATGYMAITIIISFVVGILFESPIINILKNSKNKKMENNMENKKIIDSNEENRNHITKSDL